MKMRDVTFLDLDRFCLKTIGKDSMTAHAWANIRTDVIGILRYAKKHGLTDLSVISLKDIDIPRNAFLKRRIFPGDDVITHQEARKIIEYINEHDDDIVLLGIRLEFKTGLRVGELSTLKYSDFDFQKGVLTVTRSEVKKENFGGSTKTTIGVRESTKGCDGWRQIIVDAETMDLARKIRALNPEGEYLFEIDGKRVNSNAWTKKLPRLCKRLGIGQLSKNGCYAIRKSMHKGRKNYASTLLHAGVEPKYVQAQMGHKDINTTLQYYDRDVEEFDQRRDALLPVLEKL